MSITLPLIYTLTFAFTLLITVLTESRLVPLLADKAKQPIYREGPRWHEAKQGTPTMGGLSPLLAVTITISAAALILFLNGMSTEAASLLLTLFLAVFNSLIGIIDDATKLKRKDNAGLTPTQKLLLQALVCSVFLALRELIFHDKTAVETVFGQIELGILYYPLALLLLLGIINCANLTDGIDGLASCVSLSVGMAFFYFSARSVPSSAILSSALIGASLGFLFFNIHPAKIFMGDTGSLFFGALAVGTAFSSKEPFSILIVGGVYVIEGISVILQVLYFKTTGKRLFLMSPIHHHFERRGYGENKICVIAIITTLLLSLFAFLVFKI